MLPVVRGEANDSTAHPSVPSGRRYWGAVALGATTRPDWLYAVTIVLVGGCFCGQPFDCSANAPNRRIPTFHASNAYLGGPLIAILVDTLLV